MPADRDEKVVKVSERTPSPWQVHVAAFHEKFGLVVNNSDFIMLRYENFGHKMDFPPKWKTWVE